MPTSDDLQFGRQAMAQNLVTREELAAALQEQDRRRQAGGQVPNLSETLVAMGLITESQATQVLSGRTGEGVGKTLGGYELLTKLGSGGMGTVYKARQASLNRIVALKVLPQRLAKDQDFLARFYREARSVAKLNHPNIVAGFEVGEVDGYHFLAMEFVDGQSTAGMLANKVGGLPYALVLDIAIQTAAALEHAHQNGLLHRDVKPENILVSESGAVKLCDLGLARSTTRDDLSITQAGVAVGTPHYISPEQARGQQELDPRTDIYSLGASLFHLVSGRPVFSGDNAMQIMLKHLHDAPPVLSDLVPAVPASFAAVVAKCLAKRREDRYDSMQMLVEDLNLVAAGQRPVHAPPIVPGLSPAAAAVAARRPPTGRVSTTVMKAVAARRRRPMQIVAAAAVVAVLGLAGIIFATRHEPEEPVAPPPGPEAPPVRPVPPPDPEPVAQPSANKPKELLDDADRYAKEHPGDYRRQMAMFKKVEEAGGPDNVFSRQAARKARQAEDDLRIAVEKALDPVRREAGELRAKKEYAAAADRMGRLPAELLGESLAAESAEKTAKAIRDAGVAEWEGLLAEARKLAAAEDFAGARAKVELARPFGLPVVLSGIAGELAALDKAEKDAVARRRKKAEDDCAAFHRDFLKSMAARSYDKAVVDARKFREALPADLQAKVDADLADLSIVQGVYEQARNRLKDVKGVVRFTLTNAEGETITGRFAPTGTKYDPRGNTVFDGEGFQLKRQRTDIGPEAEDAKDFRFSQLSTADILVLAGLADLPTKGRAADAERAMFFTVFDRTPTLDALQKVLYTASRNGVNTARFEGLVSGAQAGALDREIGGKLRNLESLVADKRWEDVISEGKRLNEAYAGVPAFRAKAGQVQAWLRQADEAIAARGRVELVLQDGQPVPALGIGCYTGTKDATLHGGQDMMTGGAWQVQVFGSSPSERAVVRFDLNAVPRDVVIESAWLELFCKGHTHGGARTRVRAYRVTSDWEEGTRAWAGGAQADGATWLQRGRDGGGASAPWKTPGGDFDSATDHGKGPGVLDAADAPAVQQWLRLNVTPAVRDCVSGNGRNCGFLLISESKAGGENGGIVFASRESLLQHADRRPRLVITVNRLRAAFHPPAEVRVTEQDYPLTGSAGVTAFKAAVQVSREGRISRPGSLQFGEHGLVLATDPRPWWLESKRTWGTELEVALKVDMPEGARVAVDLGDKLPEATARYWSFQHSPADKCVVAGFPAAIDSWSGQPFAALGVSKSVVPEAAMGALVAPGGRYELRFIKQGVRLRLERRGLVLAELVLSPSDEQELARRPVKLTLLVASPPAKAGESARIEELRLGPVRPRPSQLDLPEGND